MSLRLRCNALKNDRVRRVLNVGRLARDTCAERAVCLQFVGRWAGGDGGDGCVVGAAALRPGGGREDQKTRNAITLRVVGLTEEYAIAFAAERRAVAARWVRVFGFKREAVLDGRPFDRRARLDELAPEVLRLVDYGGAADFAHPLDVEGHGRRFGSNRRDRERRRDDSLAVRQGVRKVVRVGNREAVGVHGRARGIELDADGIRLKWYRPEQPARWDLGGVIVNLVRRGNPLQRSVEDVQSYEPEHALVQVAVFGNELPLHETHVGLKRQRVAELRARAESSDAIQSHESFEVGNLRRLVQCLERCVCRLRRKMVDENAQRRYASGYRFGRRALTFPLTGLGGLRNPERQSSGARRGGRQEVASIRVKLAKVATWSARKLVRGRSSDRNSIFPSSADWGGLLELWPRVYASSHKTSKESHSLARIA